MWRELDEIVKDEALFATNTSSLAVIDQAAVTEAPGALPRAALLQPGAGDEAARGRPRCVTHRRRGLRGRASSSAERSARPSCRRATRPGFIVNRLLVPYLLDAMRAYEEGVGSIERDRRRDEGRRRPSDGAADAARLRRPRHDPARSATSCSTSSASGASPRRRRCASWSPPASSAGSPDVGFYDYSGDEPVPIDHEHADDRRPRAFGEALERALAGGPERHREQAAGAGQDPGARTRRAAARPGSFAEEALLANWDADGLGRRRRRHRHGHGRRAPVALMANDPTVKAGSWGPKTVEKILRIQEQALRHGCRWSTWSTPRARGSPIRSRCSRAAAAPAASSTTRCRLSRRGAAGLRAVRPVRGRRRVHPGLLRRRDHARRQRLDVPGLAAHGGDGDRREGDARGDGRRADAHVRFAAAATCSCQDRRGGHRRSRGATCPTFPRTGGERRRRRRRARRPARRRSAR